MRKMSRLLILVLCSAQLFCYVSMANAESSSALGTPTAARLDFRIAIPAVLYLQVGTLGATVDRVSFAPPGIPDSVPVAGTSTGAYPVPVRVAALVGASGLVTLRADSSSALSDGSGNNIPFTQISWAATGNFTGAAFNGAASQQLDQFTGPGNRTGTYTFSYANANYYPAGTYNGQVTYTLSSP